MSDLEQTSIMDFLRTHTMDEHRKTEASPLMQRLGASPFSLEHYKLLLQVFFSFYESVEPMIHSFIKYSKMNYQYTAKLPYLNHDLTQLGCSLPCARNILPSTFISDKASFLGALYVLEGSTLGGCVIRKMLQNHIDVDNMATFFYPYGKSTGEHWKATCAFIESTYAKGSVSSSAIADRAIANFQVIRSILGDESINR